MSIRSTAKAIIMKDGRILLNKCYNKDFGEYYTLPGGGQHQYETLSEAVIRECMEETGYSVTPTRFAALCEEISMSEEYRKTIPQYTHKIHHIFVCELAEMKRIEPTKKDSLQLCCEWIKIDSTQDIRILPKALGINIHFIVTNVSPVFLGSEYIDYLHG
jgi:ADP-ribose pyrophosphatase YjhB (NUDIX family)